MSSLNHNALVQKARQALHLLGPDAENWVEPRHHDADVLIVGGGQTGVAIAFALRRAGVTRTHVIDAAAEGQSGIWSTTARMPTLRTPKQSTGPELGIPQLSFRYFFTSQHGEQAYDNLDRIPTDQWQAYLDWYKQVVGIAVRFENRLVGIEPNASGLQAMIATPRGDVTLSAAKIVLATGILGAGVAHVPDTLAGTVPARFVRHTSQLIAPAEIAGKRVGVVGGAASAFDAALFAARCNAVSVEHFIRGSQVLQQATGPGPVYPTAREFHFEHADEIRWKAVTLGRGRGTAPAHTVAQLDGERNYRQHLDCNVALKSAGAELELNIKGEPVPLDLLICGTGYRAALTGRAEIAGITNHILLWKDRLFDRAGAEPHWGDHPYLGRGFEFKERQTGDAPWLRNIHCYNFAAILSHGVHIGDIASASFGIPRLVEAIKRDFFKRDRAGQEAKLLGSTQVARGKSLPTARPTNDRVGRTPRRAVA